jgi:hypothetical protein
MRLLSPSRLLLPAVCLGFLLFSQAASAAGWEETYASLLSKYVTAKGLRYAAWKANAADLQALAGVTEEIGKTQPSGDRNAKLAFHINAYNAWVLRRVLDAYPTKSVRDVAPLFGFFTRDSIIFAGKKTSLNKLEKENIIKGFHESRVHFALNCASASCPPLLAEPYTGAKLDAQLDRQTGAFLNGNPLAIKLSDGGKKAEVSKIFDWYKDDFKPAGGTIGFINKYRKAKLAEDTAISFQEYNWNLNESK